MAQAQPAVLELGERAVVGLRRIAVGGVGQQRLGREHLQHLLRIGLPVGRAVQVAPGLQPPCELGHERWLDQSPLVVALLVPRVREEDVHAVEAAFRQHVVDHLHGVVLEDADVGEAPFADALEQGADAGLVHLAAEEIVLWPHARDMGRGLAHAEADLEDERCGAAESGRCVEGRGGVVEDELRAEGFEGLGLSGGGATGAADVALDRLGKGNVRGRGTVAGRRGRRGEAGIGRSGMRNCHDGRL